eukprot:PhF_6_TR7917/c0_g1_i8/m.11812
MLPNVFFHFIFLIFLIHIVKVTDTILAPLNAAHICGRANESFFSKGVTAAPYLDCVDDDVCSTIKTCFTQTSDIMLDPWSDDASSTKVTLYVAEFGSGVIRTLLYDKPTGQMSVSTLVRSTSPSDATTINLTTNVSIPMKRTILQNPSALLFLTRTQIGFLFVAEKGAHRI